MEPSRGCLSSYNGHVRTFPSKADRIMSRYRPIAPKPAAPCFSEADKLPSSAITFDNLSIRQVPDALPTPSIIPLTCRQNNKRVRKRTRKDLDTPVSNKRLAMGSLPNLAEKGLVSYGSAVEVVPLNIQEDIGFLERAAASAPSSVFHLEKARKTVSNDSQGYGGCFTEMIRDIAGLPSATQVHNLLQQQQFPKFVHVHTLEPPKRQAEGAPIQSNASVLRDSATEERSGDAFGSCFSGERVRENAERGASEDQQESGLNEEKSDGEDDGRRRVVTLNLLPEAPARGESPSISTCISSLKSSVHSSSALRNSLMYVEQVYGQFSEPVVLVHDVSHAVLWANQGYVKACKDNFNAPVSFIDPLGIPTQLGSFQVQLDCQKGGVSATLWGFLKKLLVDLGDRDVHKGIACHRSVPVESAKDAQVPWTCMLQQQQHCGMLNNSHPMVSTMSSASSVIMPQPIRLVGSVVSLESVTEIQDRDIIPGLFELAKKQLEEDSLPGFITDVAKVVRYVNPAYKVMIGQPECPWFISTMKTVGSTSTITGEVLLSCNVELPHSATSFSGRVNVQWTRKTGERTCMTVPCDVSSNTDSNAGRMLVWRFDIQASLTLTSGVGR